MSDQLRDRESRPGAASPRTPIQKDELRLWTSDTALFTPRHCGAPDAPPCRRPRARNQARCTSSRSWRRSWAASAAASPAASPEESSRSHSPARPTTAPTISTSGLRDLIEEGQVRARDRRPRSRDRAEEQSAPTGRSTGRPTASTSWDGRPTRWARSPICSRSSRSSRWAKDSKALEIEVRQSSGQPVTPESQNDEELKLIALRALMNSDAERAMPIIEQMLAGPNSPKVKDRAPLRAQSEQFVTSARDHRQRRQRRIESRPAARARSSTRDHGRQRQPADSRGRLPRVERPGGEARDHPQLHGVRRPGAAARPGQGRDRRPSLRGEAVQQLGRRWARMPSSPSSIRPRHPWT